MKLSTIRQKLYKLEQELERMMRELERSDNYKEDLFSNIVIAKDKVIEAIEALRGYVNE